MNDENFTRNNCPENAVRAKISAADVEAIEKGMDALGAVIEVAIAAAKASPTLQASGTETCRRCGGKIHYSCSTPKRRRTFLRIQCETRHCVNLIT